MPNPKKPRKNCLSCGKETPRPGYKYCTNACQLEYQRTVLIQEWKQGKISGLSNIGTVASFVKIYLRKKYENKCMLCAWSEVNEKTGLVPLVADHIDGNWRNNIESNLRLLCPNCDSLTPTYSGSNRGNGRPGRATSKRTLEGRSMKKMPS